MIDAEDPIPPEGILLLEAFEFFYRCSTPHWADLQYRLNPREKMGLDEEPRRQFSAWDEYDCAQRMANQRFRKKVTEGNLAAFVRDPRHNQTLKLPLDGWDELGEFENGITANFVGPDDLFNRGPNTVVEGKRRPVFFIRSEFEKLVEAEPECDEAPEPTKPAEPELLEPKATPTPTAASKQTHPQSERAKRHIARLYPDGTNEISSEVIRKKLEKDPVLLAELAEHGGKPPSRGSIDRARGLRR
jgi:hypothetical protein